MNGFGAPPLEKPKLHRLKFSIEQIDQFDRFFMRKDVVNMSSYRNHSKSGLPIMHFQDNKQALWEKFHAEFSNGIHRTTFMVKLQENEYIYQEDLSGLCSTCSRYGYEIFDNIRKLIKNKFIDDIKKVFS